MAETSSSGLPEMKWDAIAAYLESRIKYEPYMVRETFGFRDLESMYALVETCLPFHRIISARPPKLLPKVVSAFFYNWNKGDSVSTHSVTLGSQQSAHHINVLDAVKVAFSIGEGGALQLSKISCPQLQEALDRVLMEPRPYLERSFKRSELRPQYRLLVDFYAEVLSRAPRESRPGHAVKIPNYDGRDSQPAHQLGQADGHPAMGGGQTDRLLHGGRDRGGSASPQREEAASSWDEGDLHHNFLFQKSKVDRRAGLPPHLHSKRSPSAGDGIRCRAANILGVARPRKAASYLDWRVQDRVEGAASPCAEEEAKGRR